MIKETKEEVLNKINEKFGNDYTIEYNDYFLGVKVHIKKNSMYPIDLKLDIREKMFNSDNRGCCIEIEDYCYCESAEYLTEIENALSIINNRVTAYFEFIHGILDKLGLSEHPEIGYTNYLINGNGVFYLKNLKNERIISIEPVYKLYDKLKLSYVELVVHYVLPFDKWLMNIYIPAANISDTADALLFFLD